MFWLFRAARRLRELGILGMNRRNAACILDHNPRAKYPIVLHSAAIRSLSSTIGYLARGLWSRMHAALCKTIAVPTPEVYAAVSSYATLRRLPDVLGDRCDFVVKPNCGSGGR